MARLLPIIELLAHENISVMDERLALRTGRSVELPPLAQNPREGVPVFGCGSSSVEASLLLLLLTRLLARGFSLHDQPADMNKSGEAKSWFLDVFLSRLPRGGSGSADAFRCSIL